MSSWEFFAQKLLNGEWKHCLNSLWFTFLLAMFAICRRPSICLSSVTFGHPTQAIEIFGNVLRHLVCWTSIDFEVKFYEDHPRGTPLLEVLNRRGVAKYSKIGGKLLLMTNRKSHMSFRLVPKSVTLMTLNGVMATAK